MEKGLCVETVATHLNELLQQNPNNPQLNDPVFVSAKFLDFLHKKYKKGNLIIDKDSSLNLILPRVWVKEYVSTFPITLTRTLILNLQIFPPEFYELLFARIRENRRIKINASLPVYINKGYFNLEQVVAITKIYAKRSDLSLLRPCLAAAGDKLEVLKDLLLAVPAHNRFKALQEVAGEDRNRMLRSAVFIPEMFRSLLELFPIPDRLAFLQTRVDERFGLTLLYYAAEEKSDLLGIIFESLPDKDKITVARKHKYIRNKLVQNESVRQLVFSKIPAHDILSTYCLTYNIMNAFGVKSSSLLAKTFGFFSIEFETRTKAQQLIDALESNIGAERIKEALITFLMLEGEKPTNIQHELLKKLLACDNIENYQQKLSELAESLGRVGSLRKSNIIF